MIRESQALVLTAIAVGLLFPPGRAAGADDLAGRDLHLVGDAEVIGDRVRLTQASEYLTGAVWEGEQVEVQSGFVTQFSFAITEQGGFHNPVDGTDGADGIAFVVQNHSVGVIGETGEDVGYGGIPNSIAIEFDTWMNHGASPPEFHDPDGYHISVHTLGTAPNSADEACSLGRVSYPTLVTVDEHVAKVSYMPGTLAVYVDDLLQPVLTVSIDLGSILNLNEGRAWLGFTASTGAAFEIHEIFDWSIEELPVPAKSRTWGGVKALYR